MIHNAIARRYADALFNAAQENGQVDQVLSDWQLVIRFLQQDPRLGELLQHQRLSKRLKKEVIRELWANRVSRLFLSFLELIVDKRRERFLVVIHDVFTGKVRQVRNIAVAEVKTAFALDKQAELNLIKALIEADRKADRVAGQPAPGVDRRPGGQNRRSRD